MVEWSGNRSGGTDGDGDDNGYNFNDGGGRYVDQHQWLLAMMVLIVMAEA